ncbi:hypothetical protein ACTWPB_15840 [Nocardia sp. IBHARD005]|uniref:hypothetical protein n=1 Tax=Nocardia sp. IBHARD005 TaxID=3457765 RepID=UPI004058771A
MITAVGVCLQLGRILTDLWVLALPVLALVGLMVIVVFALALWRAAQYATKWPVAVTAAMAVVGIGTPVLFMANPEAGPWTRFWLDRPAFSAVAAMELPDRDGYYGTQLPGHLCFVSVTCKVATIGTSDGHPVRFLPDYTGIPDGATGYAHFAGRPGAGPYDGFGDPICPRTELAGGWWWLGPCPSTSR